MEQPRDDPAPVIQTPVIDLQQFENMSRMMGDGFQELLSAFSQSVTELLAQWPAAMESDDRKELTRIAHSIKSAGNNIGAARLSGVAEKLEKRAMTLERDVLAAGRDKLEREFQAAGEALRQLVDKE